MTTALITQNQGEALSSLLPVTAQLIGDGKVSSVNARDLHRFLEVGKDFTNWIKAQIERARLLEHRDFEVFALLGENSQGGRPRNEYALTLDAAKHVAMMAGTDKGFEVRDYFLECERRANDPVHALMTMTRTEMLEMATTIAKERDTLRTQNANQAATIATLAPKAEFSDRVSRASTTDSLSFREFAKLIGTGQNRLCEWLRIHGFLIPGTTEPYQEFIDRGYFRTIEEAYDDAKGKDRIYTKTLITPKGQIFLYGKWNESVA